MDFTTPVIMIGPGTGVSSFIGYIEYRKTIWGDNIIDPVNTILFFGSCYKEKEFYY
jgi:sulfite reductase alpha subunit-like flavoprotein